MRWAPALLGLCSALLFTVWLGARDLWNPNEPLYGRAVAEMWESGNWLVPTVNGEVFPEKPILYYWAALLAAALLGGVRELTLRLPSAVAGTVGVLLLYRLVRAYTSSRRAGIAGALFATMYVVFWSARQVQMDLLLAACTLGSLLPLLLAVDEQLSCCRGFAIGGAAAGLGFLAKGPVGVLVPAIVFLGYLVATRRVREVQRTAVLCGGAAFLLVAAPWYFLLAVRGEGGFLVEVLYRQNVLRFLDPWDHAAPWWYYLETLWQDMLPWSLWLPLAAGLSAGDERESRLHRLAWIWLAGTIVFFSLSASKRSPYILPAAPALAILVSGVAERWWTGSLDRRRLLAAWLIVGVCGLALLAGGLYLGRVASRYHPDDTRLQAVAHATIVLLIACGSATLLGLLVRWRRRFGAAAALFGGVLALYLFVPARVLPAVNPYKSPRAMGEIIRRHVKPGESIRGFHVWKWRASYSYYAGRSIPALTSTDELRRYWSGPGPLFLIVEEGLLDEARTVVGAIEPLASRHVGDNAAHLFSKDGS